MNESSYLLLLLMTYNGMFISKLDKNKSYTVEDLTSLSFETAVMFIERIKKERNKNKVKKTPEEIINEQLDKIKPKKK